LETTYFGVTFEANDECTIGVTGAMCNVEVNAQPANWGLPVALRKSDIVRISAARDGVRTYVAIDGGVDVIPTFGSRSTDLLSGIGPKPLSRNQTLNLGPPSSKIPAVDIAPYLVIGTSTMLRVHLGPRAEQLGDRIINQFFEHKWLVTSGSSRTALRLSGLEPLTYHGPELRSEGLVAGAIQIPHDGQPLVFLADHPVTGGYPILATLCDHDLDLCAQLKPDTALRFRRTPLC
jgi:biotin-dependent carboxylase-like uncharacterized protein